MALLPHAVETTLLPKQLAVLDALAFVSGYTGKGARADCLHELVAAALEEAEDDPAVQRVLAAARHPSNNPRLRAVP